VDATLLKISNVARAKKALLQNDFGFLKRIALVESNFGNATLQQENGGIWQVTIQTRTSGGRYRFLWNGFSL